MICCNYVFRIIFLKATWSNLHQVINSKENLIHRLIEDKENAEAQYQNGFQKHCDIIDYSIGIP